MTPLASLKEAYPPAAKLYSVQAGFRVSDIYPYSKYVFPDSEFSPSYVIDRPMPFNAVVDNSPALLHPVDLVRLYQLIVKKLHPPPRRTATIPQSWTSQNI